MVENTKVAGKYAAIKGQEPDAVLHKDGRAPLEVRISEKHDYGCKLPHGTKFYLHPPVADKDAELPLKTTPAIREALRTGSRKDYPSDELCEVRWATIRAAVAKGSDGGNSDR